MLIFLRGFDILLSHYNHNCLKVSSLRHHPGPVIMTTTVQNQIFRQSGFCASFRKMLSDGAKVWTLRRFSARWKYPALLL